MAKKNYFTPGPAELYPTFMMHMVKAIGLQIPSISHRSKEFTEIYKNTCQDLRTLLQIPEEFAIFFTSSATEIWERLLMSCVETESFHLVNGAFSKRFFEIGQQLHKNPTSLDAPLGEGFYLETLQSQIPQNAELIAFTHNETSTGVCTPEEVIHSIAKQHSDKIIAVDMVSSAPYPTLDYQIVDTAYFSVQKAFGLPAGLGVWIVSPKCLEKTKSLEAKGLSTGSYHSITSLWKSFEKFQTPATPNVLSIYLFGKIVEDMLQKGVSAIRKETDEKAQKLYDFVEKTNWLSPAVPVVAHRSPTVIVVNTKIAPAKVLSQLAQKRLIIGKGYKPHDETQIRIANFPATSMAKIDMLIEALTQISA